jgi:hypothetical protein
VGEMKGDGNLHLHLDTVEFDSNDQQIFKLIKVKGQ